MMDNREKMKIGLPLKMITQKQEGIKKELIETIKERKREWLGRWNKGKVELENKLRKSGKRNEKIKKWKNGVHI